MPLDPSFIERNRASTERIRTLAGRLTDIDLQTPVGPDWTVAVLLAHLAFWDRRVLLLLDKTEQDGKVYTPQFDVILNDIALPFWSAIPPRAAATLAIDIAEQADKRLESFPPALLEQVYDYNKRLVDRSLHRGEHLDEAEAALAKNIHS